MDVLSVCTRYLLASPLTGFMAKRPEKNFDLPLNSSKMNKTGVFTNPVKQFRQVCNTEVGSPRVS